MKRAAWWVCLLMLCLEPGQASAHALSKSQSWWRIDGQQVTVQVSVPWLEIHRRFDTIAKTAPTMKQLTAPMRTFLAMEIPKNVRLDHAGAICRQIAEPKIRMMGVDRLLIAWQLHCSSPAPSAVTVDLFFEQAPSHLHLLVLEDEQGRHDAILHEGRRTMVFDASSSLVRATTLGPWAQVRRGAFHVWEGLDHLAFVLVLMLLGGRLVTFLIIATGFTLGHMATLSMAALGLVQADIPSVEVLVGLSIAYGALTCFEQWFPEHGRWKVLTLNIGLHALLMGLVIFERSNLNLSLLVASAIFTSCHLQLHQHPKDQRRSRMLLAALFGLIHGLAFASSFAELVAKEHLLSSLLCFNLGIELAHIAFIISVGIVWTSIRHACRPQTQTWILASSGALIFACGFAWTVERALY